MNFQKHNLSNLQAFGISGKKKVLFLQTDTKQIQDSEWAVLGLTLFSVCMHGAIIILYKQMISNWNIENNWNLDPNFLFGSKLLFHKYFFVLFF